MIRSRPQGEGNSAEDSGPAGYDADLQCGSKGSTCTSTSSWWVSGVGSRSLSLGKVHRVTSSP